MQDREKHGRNETQARALEQGQANRGKTAASAKARLVNPDQAAGRGPDARLGNV